MKKQAKPTNTSVQRGSQLATYYGQEVLRQSDAVILGFNPTNSVALNLTPTPTLVGPGVFNNSDIVKVESKFVRGDKKLRTRFDRLKVKAVDVKMNLGLPANSVQDEKLNLGLTVTNVGIGSATITDEESAKA